MDDTERRSRFLGAAVDRRLLDPETAPIAAFIDWVRVEENVAHLHRAFPQDVPVLHAFAAKANTLVPVMSRLRTLGMGAEVASLGELRAAFDAGHVPERMVFDSPAKSRAELREALDAGVAINMDNFQELGRVTQMRGQGAFRLSAGMRINPQTGTGRIAEMSTASPRSKFGVPLRDPGMREQLVDAYLSHPWMRRAHVHVGSQGCSLPLIADGVGALVEFADEVNSRAGWAQIETLDIGGGLPVDFESDEPLSVFDDYVGALAERAPRIFSGDYALVTEFGRSILAKHGFIAAYVEYTKEVGGRRIAITHAGAQVATRTVFMPDAWPLRIATFSGDGRPKSMAPSRLQDIAGPCCFAGDLVASGRDLPVLEQGDLVALLDTGAYYASTPFHYNSLPEPPVYGIETGSRTDALAFEVIRAAR